MHDLEVRDSMEHIPRIRSLDSSIVLMFNSGINLLSVVLRCRSEQLSFFPSVQCQPSGKSEEPLAIEYQRAFSSRLFSFPISSRIVTAFSSKHRTVEMASFRIQSNLSDAKLELCARDSLSNYALATDKHASYTTETSVLS